MALDGVSKLGNKIGSMSVAQDELQQNISPNEDIDLDTVKVSESMTISGTVTGTKKVYASDSFILDHVVLGDLDSSTLKLDGGYASGALTLPFTFPATFAGGDEVLFTLTL